MKADIRKAEISVGVGLRHTHYTDVLTSPKSIDFVEVHAENFFAAGGAAIAFLEEVAGTYPVSLHATSLGLGSAQGVPERPVSNLKILMERVPPYLVSDHACFAWTSVHGSQAHAGDLLPIPFNEAALDVMVANVDFTQQRIGRALLVENLSAYIGVPGSTMPEVEFLTRLCQRSGCQLLLDLNNLVVNATNAGVSDHLGYVKDFLCQLPVDSVGEIHLAGCAPALPNAPMIDDHSRPVPQIVWQAYRLALRRFGATPTLIEWDNALPSWQGLCEEARKAKIVAEQELHNDIA